MEKIMSNLKKKKIKKKYREEILCGDLIYNRLDFKNLDKIYHFISFNKN